MTTLRVEIDEEKDLSLLQKVLTELGFKFSMENDNYELNNLSQAAISGINAGLKDIEEGRVFSHENAMSRINKRLLSFAQIMLLSK